MSRTKLDEAIGELEPEKAEQLRCELNWLTNEIHLLDHRKGEAEGRLAMARLEAEREPMEMQAIKPAEVLAEVKRLELQHDEYVEKIGVLRDRVVLEIEILLGDAQQ